jgi:hypothetical protein
VFYDPLVAPFYQLFPALGMESGDLARAMIETGLSDPRPASVLENRELRAISR